MSDETELVHERRTSARFDSVEGQHQSLQKDVQALAKDLSGLMIAVQSLTSSVTKLTDNQSRLSRTDWPVVVSSVGVIVLIAGLVLYEPLTSLRTVLFNHLGDGHPESVVERVHSLAEIVDDHSKVGTTATLRFEDRLDAVEVSDTGINERLLGIEREIYSSARYRAGRPVYSEPQTIVVDPR